MSAATSPSWIDMLFGGGVAAVLVALINKFRPKEDVAAVRALAEKQASEGDAAMIAAMASAFPAALGSMRELIERLQAEARQMREQAISHEADLRAALARLGELEQRLAENAVLIDRLRADVERLRAARDASDQAAAEAQARVIQQEGEIRQLKATIDAQSRASANGQGDGQ